MQADYKHIYKLTSERTGKSQTMYKDLGNLVFATLYTQFRRPKSIITKLKGVGSWYLRRKRMKILLEMFPPNFNKTQEDFSSPLEFLRHENRIEIFTLFTERVKEYEEYVKLKAEIRSKRNESQVLLQPDKRED